MLTGILGGEQYVASKGSCGPSWGCFPTLISPWGVSTFMGLFLDPNIWSRGLGTCICGSKEVQSRSSRLSTASRLTLAGWRPCTRQSPLYPAAPPANGLSPEPRERAYRSTEQCVLHT